MDSPNGVLFTMSDFITKTVNKRLSIRARSNKGKGRNGQKEVVELLHKYAPELEPGDLMSTSMGQSGEDVHMSPAGRRRYPFVIEVKRKKAVGAARFIEQAYDNKDGKYGKSDPLVFFREDKLKGGNIHPTQGRWMCMMDAEYFLNIYKILIALWHA